MCATGAHQKKGMYNECEAACKGSQLEGNNFEEKLALLQSALHWVASKPQWGKLATAQAAGVQAMAKIKREKRKESKGALGSQHVHVTTCGRSVGVSVVEHAHVMLFAGGLGVTVFYTVSTFPSESSTRQFELSLHCASKPI